MNETKKYFKCITNKYGNFTEGKIYEARSGLYRLSDKLPTNFRISDDDGDYYTIDLEKDAKQRRMFEEVDRA